MPCKVVPFKSHCDRKVRGTDVKKGQQLYAIQDSRTKLYFVWCYSSEEYARVIAERAKPESAPDVAANWRKDIRDTVPTDRSKDG